MLCGCGHEKQSVIANQSADWCGNPLWRGTAVSIIDRAGILQEIATAALWGLLAMTCVLCGAADIDKPQFVTQQKSPEPVVPGITYLLFSFSALAMAVKPGGDDDADENGGQQQHQGF